MYSLKASFISISRFVSASGARPACTAATSASDRGTSFT